MLRNTLVLLGGLLVWCTHGQHFKSIDKETFELYSTLWERSHQSWMTTKPHDAACFNSSRIVFPVCLNGNVIEGKYSNELSNQQCYQAMCVDKKLDCFPTPQDSLEYIPPLESTAEDRYICQPPQTDAKLFFPYFGFDEGIPPLFTPVSQIRLDLNGTVYSQFGSTCGPVAGATIQAWQLDAVALEPYTDRSEYIESLLNSTSHDIDHIGMSAQSPKPASLRDLTCTGKLRTQLDGSFGFVTSVPPSYGPPRHIALRVSAPGYETLHTRVYFDRDGRLMQLTGSIDDRPELVYGQIKVSSDQAHAQLTQEDTRAVLIPMASESIRRDPRVSHVVIDKRSAPDAAGNVFGRFQVHVNLFLKPTGSSDSAPNKPAIDISGLWADKEGGWINIETLGTNFIATEYPHARSWGTVHGIVSEGVVRGVNFFNPSAADAWTTMQARGVKAVVNNSDESFNQVITPANIDGSTITQESLPLNSILSPTVWSTGLSTGVVEGVDDFVTTPYEATIHWNGGGYTTEWSKLQSSAQHGYRYFKLVINRVTGGFPGGVLHINEIQFYSGVLNEFKFPTQQMLTPRTPAPLLIACSSYESLDSHCYKLFDGDSSLNSAWVTQPVGDRNHALTVPQWFLIDLGAGHFQRPTGLRIVCNAGKATPSGCPRTFSLLGSRDNILFDVLNQQDLYDYTNEYAVDGGKLFTFFWESATGRARGHRCGSCDTAPNFACAVDAFDATCASSYCDTTGKCGVTPECRLGEYMDINFVADGKKEMKCVQCPPGRFGNSTRLSSPACSGQCMPGYFCPPGSTSAMQYPCGDASVICPVGSAKPVLVSTGKYSVGPVITGLFDRNLSALSDPSTRTDEVVCPPGHYCEKGIILQCPIGTYGNTTGLASPMCWTTCLPGEYCPLGSIVPTVCAKGNYCPDGKYMIPCPAGTFGVVKGLIDRYCSGLCKPGYFCPSGSVSSSSQICPAGRYGSTSGLQDKYCSGPCQVGHYCPAGSTSSKAHVCGDPILYCPMASGYPTIVGFGNYTFGGTNVTQSAERPCEEGFYCQQGVQYPCPPGTFGSSIGMNYITYPGEDSTTHLLAGQRALARNEISSDSPFPVDFVARDKFTCSGFCEPGYYCPFNSTNSMQVPCPAGRYGSTFGLTNASCTAACPVGYYCPAGSSSPTICRAGLFGNQTGLISSECSGACWDGGCEDSLCQEGYYCPAGSTVATQAECGGNGFYCPKGSAAPIPVSPGYYSVGPFPVQNAKTRTDQVVCEIGYFCANGLKRPCFPGTYGDTPGLSSPDCSGLCPLGYYCPTGTSNATALKCPAGRYGSTLGLYTSDCSGSCTLGYYCPEGSISSTQYQCSTADAAVLGIPSESIPPVQTLPMPLLAGASAGAGSALQGPTTSGNNPVDRPGLVSRSGYLDEHIEYYWLPVRYRNSTGDLSLVLTAMAKYPNELFCLAGVGKPLTVLPGYYSFGNNKTTRYGQAPCPPGSYCQNGVIYDCPAGRYGITERLDSPMCSGPCQSGYYCPTGSVSRTEFPCPRGRYGSEEGLSTMTCSGGCKHVLDCPPGSTRSTTLSTEPN